VENRLDEPSVLGVRVAARHQHVHEVLPVINVIIIIIVVVVFVIVIIIIIIIIVVVVVIVIVIIIIIIIIVVIITTFVIIIIIIITFLRSSSVSSIADWTLLSLTASSSALARQKSSNVTYSSSRSPGLICD
jgi:hypothetical protein